MRYRSLFAFLLVVAVATWSAASFIGAAEEESEAVPAETEAVTVETEAETAETEAAPAELEVAADPFLDQGLVTITPVHTVYCPCQVGVNCCGDPGAEITCGNNRYCVCNGANDCVLQHVHGK